MARLAPLFSGSSGNSYYIGSKEAGLLIDAGRSAKQLEIALRRCGIDPLAVQGILLTHEHNDHISGLRVFASRFGLPVFSTEGTREALEQAGVCGGFSFFPLEQGLQIADLEVDFFHTSHDSAESCGYRIKTADGKILALATDLGCPSPEVVNGLEGADFVILESNHDLRMLELGPYPYPLKQRIRSERGHLSNTDCAALLPGLQKAGSRRFLLAHLSAENNTPELAYQTSLCAMTMNDLILDQDFTLSTAPRENTAGECIIF